MFDKFIEIRPVIIEGEPEAHSVHFKVGVQSFCISPHGCDNKEHAEWLADMFKKALTNMLQESGALTPPATRNLLDGEKQRHHRPNADGAGTERKRGMSDQDDVCGFCNLPGADKFPHPVRWPGEQSAGTELVHAECENLECERAFAALSEGQRRKFLETL